MFFDYTLFIFIEVSVIHLTACARCANLKYKRGAKKATHPEYITYSPYGATATYALLPLKAIGIRPLSHLLPNLFPPSQFI